MKHKTASVLALTTPVLLALVLLGLQYVPTRTSPSTCGPGQPCTPASITTGIGTFSIVDAGVVYAPGGFISSNGGVSTSISGVTISNANVLRDNSGLGIGQYGLSIQGTALNGASARALQISNSSATLTSANAEVAEFIAGAATTYNTGSERDVAAKVAWVDSAGRLFGATPATLGEALVNTTVTATNYWWTVLPSSSPFVVQRLTMRNSTAAVGAGNVVFRVTDGTYNCDTTVACSSFSGNVTLSASTSGDCAFAPSSSLSFGVQTAGCATTQPTIVGNVRIEGKWSPGNAPRFQYGSSIAWLGDSITKGELCYNNYPTKKLNELEPSGSVANYGRAGNTTSQMQSNWTSNIRSQGYRRLVLLGGINDILTTNDSGATIFARLETIIDQAIADGMAVTPVTVLPANLSGSQETRRNDLNTLILAKCVSAALTCADADTALRDSGNHAILQSSYNGGDNIHLSDSGCTALATSVAGAF